MKLQSCLLCDTVQLMDDASILILNSAPDPFVRYLLERFRLVPASSRTITLAEDNIAAIDAVVRDAPPGAGRATLRPLAFHDYVVSASTATIDVAVMNLLYQPSNSWILYGLQAALFALKPGGYLYVVGSKERGILTIARRMEEYFGNVETLLISKGHRVLRSRKAAGSAPREQYVLEVFAGNKLDEGTRLLLETIQVRATDDALDIGGGAGFIGLHIARLATKGRVTMVDVSQAAVAAARRAVEKSGLSNVRALPSDGVQAVKEQRFDLVATNPPFHQGGLQTTAIAERFIREAAMVLRPKGRFYLVANRFLRYEPTLHACFASVKEVGGNTRYKVLQGLSPRTK